MSTALDCGVTVRTAETTDNTALLQLAAACPMQGDIGICVDRAPDFFALNRLQGDSWRVGVAETDEGGIAGCGAAALRTAYVNGKPAALGYAADLKVAPDWRGSGAADQLTHWIADTLGELGGSELPILLTILAGNQRMERRTPGQRGLPRLTRFATIRSFSIPLLLPLLRGEQNGFVVTPAVRHDIPEMVALWSMVAPHRQFAPVFNEERFANWLSRADLGISAYRVVRDACGRITGFFALWDQHQFKQLRVTAYSRRFGAVKRVFNAIAPVMRAPLLPQPGGALKCVTAAHVCVPANHPDVLRALIADAYDELRGRYAILNLGLDLRDPLCAALRGFMAQPTDVHAYLTTPTGGRELPALDGRPLHYEIALV